MGKEGLKEKAALAAFQALIQRGEDDDTGVLASRAWDAAEDFVDNYPSLQCESCPTGIVKESMARMTREGIAGLTDKGATPATPAKGGKKHGRK